MKNEIMDMLMLNGMKKFRLSLEINTIFCFTAFIK